MKTLVRLIGGDQGQDLIEYALLGALLSIVSVLALRALGPVISNVFPRFTQIISSV